MGLAGAHLPMPAVPQDAARTREPLVDAATLAAELGVSRDWVYEHAAELGALRLGSGPRARLRFDPVAARAALSCYGSERSQPQTANAGGESEAASSPRRRRLPDRSPQPGSILPVRPRRKVAGMRAAS
jgi:hypothetical protein